MVICSLRDYIQRLKLNRVWVVLFLHVHYSGYSRKYTLVRFGYNPNQIQGNNIQTVIT